MLVRIDRIATREEIKTLATSDHDKTIIESGRKYRLMIPTNTKEIYYGGRKTIHDTVDDTRLPYVVGSSSKIIPVTNPYKNILSEADIAEYEATMNDFETRQLHK